MHTRDIAVVNSIQRIPARQLFPADRRAWRHIPGPEMWTSIQCMHAVIARAGGAWRLSDQERAGCSLVGWRSGNHSGRYGAITRAMRSTGATGLSAASTKR